METIINNPDPLHLFLREIKNQNSEELVNYMDLYIKESGIRHKNQTVTDFMNWYSLVMMLKNENLADIHFIENEKSVNYRLKNNDDRQILKLDFLITEAHLKALFQLLNKNKTKEETTSFGIFLNRIDSSFEGRKIAFATATNDGGKRTSLTIRFVLNTPK